MLCGPVGPQLCLWECVAVVVDVVVVAVCYVSGGSRALVCCEGVVIRGGCGTGESVVWLWQCGVFSFPVWYHQLG